MRYTNKQETDGSATNGIDLEKCKTRQKSFDTDSESLCSTELDICNRLGRGILHEDQHFYRYKLVMEQQLKAQDYAQRLNFARQMEAIFQANDNLNELVVDEAHFHLNGKGNQQNCCLWALKNPRELHERPLHKPKVTVCYATGKTTVIFSYFFEDNNENVATVNSEMTNNILCLNYDENVCGFIRMG